MPNFFRNFPVTLYRFGDEVNPTIFQNISAYVSLIDEIKDEVTAYNVITINDDERPDTLSQKLYGTVNHYWTFYFLNDKIRESGWPLNELQTWERAKTDYPNWTLTTRANISDRFLEGEMVMGTKSGAVGYIVKRNLDLGQIIVNKTSNENFRSNELITAINETGVPDNVQLTGAVVQYNSVHHYENTDGEWVDIDPYSPNTTGLIPITYMNRIRAKNDDLKEIKVFTQTVVSQIETEFNKLLLRGANA